MTILNRRFFNLRHASYFETLNDSLESEGLLEIFPVDTTVAYGETIRVIAKGAILISIYRDNKGRYERPVHYSTYQQ